MAGSALATPTVVGGLLVGATNINVGGTLFDVDFVDGTCVALFTGCDNAVADFDFTNSATATTAGQALLDQIFQDSIEGAFDTDPTLTLAGGGSLFLQALIPFNPAGGAGLMSSSYQTRCSKETMWLFKMSMCPGHLTR